MYYRLTSDNENFRNYRLPKRLSSLESVKLSESFDGRSHKDGYKTINFEMTLDSEKEYPIADFQESHVPFCSENAKKVIEAISDENEIEFLPCNLEGTEEQYYILNVLGLEDCVDYDKSKFTRFPSTGRIMFFEHIEFNKEVDRHFFRIKDLPYAHYFVSQEAKDKLEQANLKGLVFSNKLFKK